MPRRQPNKFLKVLLLIFVYLIVYLLLSFLLRPSPIYNFVSDDIRVGDKYVLMYLVSSTAVFSDAEGAEVFRRRRCGRCFLTNNKGFLPVGAYDAVLVHGDRQLLSDAAAFMEPGKRYALDAPSSCLNKKLLDCDVEPILTSFATRGSYDLCSLCRYLHQHLKESGFIATDLTNREKVLLLEAGEEENIDYDIPGVPTRGYRPILWNYRTERNGFSCLSRPGGSCEVLTGKVLGGSSVTNDMKYTRGAKVDYDSWHKNGEIGSIDWKFGNLLEYFKASEDNGDYDTLMNSHYHARGGEMRVQRFKYADRYLEVFSAAFAEMGLRTLDANINAPEVIVNHQFALFNNTRLSTNSAFLKPVRHRKNLSVITGATVSRIVIDRTEKTVDGVIYEFDKGKERPAYAKREIILTGGAVNNVKLLHMSGIGPKAELKKHNITVLMNLPVGLNYQDQVTTGGLSFSLPDVPPVSENQVINDFKTWFQSRSGALASRGINQLSAFIQLYEQNNAPDVEISLEGNFIRSDKFMLTNVSVHAAEESNLPLAYYNLINLYPILLRPKSKGKVTLNKRNPKYGRPVITANLLKEPEDLETLVDAIDISLQLLDKKEMKKAEIKFAPIDLFPCDRLRNRDQWNCIARHYTKAVGNPIGTCRMGGNATDSVVDFELKVHGIEGLRIVDASIMPTHVRGGIFAPTMMIAEKAAKMISKDWKEEKGFFYNKR